MPSTLIQSRCFQHASREAVARCPECRRFYCRECVTEHEGRMICRGCLSDLLERDKKESSGWLKAIGSWCMAAAGFLLTTSVFYLLGRLLLRIPSTFHSGTFFE